MQLLGSVIYLTSTFYDFEGVDSLVHWTHSFCVFMVTPGSEIFKMECSIRKKSKYHLK